MLENELLKVLKEIFINKVRQYDTKREAIEAFRKGDFNEEERGINELAYHHQTIELFKKYPVETMELLDYIGDELGESVHWVKSMSTENRINYYIWYIFHYYIFFWMQDIAMEALEERQELYKEKNKRI